MEKYYYVIIDKRNKTMKVRECNTCLAMLEKQISEEENITRWQVETKYNFFFNGTNDKIDFETIYKYARKFTIVE
jgi:hypothetical protein